jgi:class 3 adenylate cyclase
MKKTNLNDSTTSSTTDDSSHKKKKVKYINISSLSWKERLILFYKSKYFQTYTFIITIIILILGDIHKITPLKADLSFKIIHVVFALFVFIEIIIYFVANESYGFSLHFFIDIIFLISIIFEITDVYESIIYTEGKNYLRTNMDTYYFINIMKVIRIIRIIRIGKIVAMFNYMFLERKYGESDNDNYGEENENISTTFINFSSHKIFLFYVLIIIAQVIFSHETYFENPLFDENYIMKLFSNLGDLNENSISKLLLFNTFINTFSKSKESLIYAKIDKLVYINDTYKEKKRKYEQLIYYEDLIVQNETKQQSESISNLRYMSENDREFDEINKELLKKYVENIEEIDKIINYDVEDYIKNLLLIESNKNEIKIINSTNINIFLSKEEQLSELELIPSEDSRQNKNIIVYDNFNYTYKYYFFNLVRTFFSIGIFLFIYLLFLYDINNVILSSIEQMVKKVEKMAKNPSLASDSYNDINEDKNHCISFLESSQGKCRMSEFKIIISKISKICSLVSFGFGEAGTQIISQVLKEGLNVDINPLIPGKKVMGIYGFCDIRNFTDTTEILKERVMIFVNQVAEIVHQITADYCGSANKNIGDAFLLVWKLEDRFIKEEVNNQGKKELKLKNVNRINQICDMVLICFIRILIEINKSYKLAEYRHHKGLNARMKNYKTRLGFGLHLGQSIEGAIGSMFKIDASYLSTDVNMANELEENTKTFKKELIMSGDFYDYLSEDAKAYVRLLDIFKSKSGQITRLYSVDLDLENIPIEKQKDSMFKENNIEKKWEIIKQKRKISKILYDDIVIRHKSDIWNEFVMEEDDFRLVREKYPDEFVETYNNGMEEFKKGNWAEAKNLLTNAQNLISVEDPAIKLNLEYMAKHNFFSPENWKGYKEEE